MNDPRLPRPARWLVRLSPVPPAERPDIEADLYELFIARRQRGVLHAHWRLFRDAASLWRHPTAIMDTTTFRSPVAYLRDAVADLRYAARLFARQPVILLLAIVGLSLGLAVATAAFTVMNAAVLKGEGLVDADRIPALLRVTDRSESTTWKYDEFERLRDGVTHMQVEGVLTEVALVRTRAAESEAASLPVGFVSGGFFAATGGRAAFGRPLERADERHAGPPRVVVSHAFWTSRLDRDPQAIGRTIRVGRTDATIVGVAAPGFSLPNHRMLWMPLTAYAAVYDAAPVKRTPDAGIQVSGRLLPGVSYAEAEAQASGVAAGDRALRVRLDSQAGPGRAATSETVATSALVFAVIGLVLLLACANVASVLVATAMTRDREIGVRAALGASRSRIVRQLITESLALGAVAAGLGLLMTHWGLPAIAAMVEAPAGSDLEPDLTVYLFLGIVTVLTGIGAGLAPAWHGRGTDLVTPLKGDSARQHRVAPRRLRSVLVMTQAAVSVLLIVLATLFVRATFRAAAIDVGFEADGLWVVSPGRLDPGADGGAALKTFWTRAMNDLRGTPGLGGVALAEVTPFDGIIKTSATRDTPPRVIRFNSTDAAYFDTIGLRLLAGRTYTGEEAAAAAPVAVVSESVARAYFPNRSPLGQTLPREIPVPPSLVVGAGGTTLAPSEHPVIVGVVADAITADLHERNPLAVYQPLRPASEAFAQLLIRVAPGATGALQQASQRLRALDPEADVRILSVATRVQEEAGRPRVLAILSGIVGLLAIVLCVIGLYGLTASVVGQRTREMGIRLALGAEPRELLRLLLWDSLRPVLLGLGLGAGAALLAGRVMLTAMLFGVSPQDPLAYAGAALILVAAATLAVLVPTRRAASVDAAFVLRQ